MRWKLAHALAFPAADTRGRDLGGLLFQLSSSDGKNMLKLGVGRDDKRENGRIVRRWCVRYSMYTRRQLEKRTMRWGWEGWNEGS